MTAGQVAAHVRAQHRQLAALHHALFSDRGERQAGAVPLRLEPGCLPLELGCGTARRIEASSAQGSVLPALDDAPVLDHRIRSALRSVESRWAITSDVRPANALLKRLLHRGLRRAVEVRGRLLEHHHSGCTMPTGGGTFPAVAAGPLLRSTLSGAAAMAALQHSPRRVADRLAQFYERLLAAGGTHLAGKNNQADPGRRSAGHR